MVDARGAEAEITFQEGEVLKERVEKGYRHPDLDERLRGERTEKESRLLQRARQAGVRVPGVDVEDDFTLVLEEIGGELLKEVFEERTEAWEEVGRGVGRLHGRNIVHGDLTTSNMILEDGEVYFIDFGLGFFSERTEDRATDLHLLKEVLESTHTEVAEEAMEEILEGYREEFEEAEEVMERYREVEGRGRYR